MKQQVRWALCYDEGGERLRNKSLEKLKQQWLVASVVTSVTITSAFGAITYFVLKVTQS